MADKFALLSEAYALGGKYFSNYSENEYCDYDGANVMGCYIDGTYKTNEFVLLKDLQTIYTIEFDSNGGTGSVSNITNHGLDPSKVVMGNLDTSSYVTKTGYNFRGWGNTLSYSNYRIAYNTGKYGGDSDYNGISAKLTSSSWTFSDYCNGTNNSDESFYLKLYAQWEACRYTNYLTYFNINTTLQLDSENIVIYPNTSWTTTVTNIIPTKENSEEYDESIVGGTATYYDSYTFKNWNTKSDGSGESYSPGDSITVGSTNATKNQEVDLFAQWDTTKNSVKITYKTYTNTISANGGTFNGKDTIEIKTTYGSSTNNLLSELPTYEGHTLKGIYTDSDLGNRIWDSSGKWELSSYWDENGNWVVPQGHNFYAHWN